MAEEHTEAIEPDNAEPADQVETTSAEQADPVEAPPAPLADPSSHRTLTWVVVAVIAVVLIAGIAYGMSRDRGDDTASTISSAGETDVPMALGGSAGESSTVPGAAQPGQSGSEQPGAGTGTSATRPGEPAAEGSELATIAQPPDATLAMIDPAQLKADARYTIVFSPYGYGPPRSGAQALVVHVDEATARNESAAAMDFTGRNLLATLARDTEAVKLGGTHTGVLTFQAQGDLLVPLIAEVKAKE